jgi:hypothetical protein
MDDDTIPRVGVFFLLVGGALLILFAASVFSKETHVLYLLIGTAALFLGFIFRRRAAPPPPSTRFSGIRKVNEGFRKSRAERDQKRGEKKKR